MFDYPIYKDSENLYIPMVTGAQAFEKEGKSIPSDYERDDSLDHISWKNDTYAEFTGQYWVWKNVSADIVGFIQYRRYFVKESFEQTLHNKSFALGGSRIYKPFCNNIDPYDYILDRDYIESMLSEYDLCVKVNREIPISYLVRSYGVDFTKKLKSVIQELCPEYMKDLEIALQDSVNYHCNMYIGKKEVLDRYWAWIFPILDRLAELDMKFKFETDMYDKRFAYVGEVLLKVWIDHNKIPCKIQDSVVLQRYEAKPQTPCIPAFHEIPKLVCRHLNYQNKQKKGIVADWRDAMYEKRIVVTGASGFLGKSLCKKLAYAGAEVYAIVRNSESDVMDLSSIENIHIVPCGLDQIQQLSELIDEKIDYFYHFGWEGTAGEKRGDEALQLLNVKRTCESVRVAAKLGCKKFVFASSIMEYEVEKRMQDNKKLPLSSIYSLCKRNAEQLGRVVADEVGIEYVCALISNVYGPGEKSERLINSSIRKLLKGEKTAFTSGQQLYDFIYIDDAIEYFKVIATKGQHGKSYYVGNEKPQKLKDFLMILGEELCPGKDIGIGELEGNVDGLYYTEFDTKAVQREFGVQCKIAFRDGIRKTTESIKREL